MFHYSECLSRRTKTFYLCTPSAVPFRQWNFSFFASHTRLAFQSHCLSCAFTMSLWNTACFYCCTISPTVCTDSYSSHIYCPVRRQAMIIPTGRPVPKATKATLALRLGMCLCACVFICRRPGSLFLFPANSDCFYFALFALLHLFTCRCSWLLSCWHNAFPFYKCTAVVGQLQPVRSRRKVRYLVNVRTLFIVEEFYTCRKMTIYAWRVRREGETLND